MSRLYITLNPETLQQPHCRRVDGILSSQGEGENVVSRITRKRQELLISYLCSGSVTTESTVLVNGLQQANHLVPETPSWPA
mmetsp:Transcript_18027/g.26547  ORF Transcript_18027/g.26547 Transcript_18027/m.26547 type:complete len:82 (-) Transcript_18027:255-500(-)